MKNQKYQEYQQMMEALYSKAPRPYAPCPKTLDVSGLQFTCAEVQCIKDCLDCLAMLLDNVEERAYNREVPNKGNEP